MLSAPDGEIIRRTPGITPYATNMSSDVPLRSHSKLNTISSITHRSPGSKMTASHVDSEIGANQGGKPLWFVFSLGSRPLRCTDDICICGQVQINVLQRIGPRDLQLPCTRYACSSSCEHLCTMPIPFYFQLGIWGAMNSLGAGGQASEFLDFLEMFSRG